MTAENLALSGPVKRLSGAERVAYLAAGAQSAGIQAVVDQAPPLTRQQLDTARAACAAATAQIRAPEAVARAS